MERTKSTPEGLIELDLVNQNIAKYINDTFTNYEKFVLVTFFVTYRMFSYMSSQKW